MAKAVIKGIAIAIVAVAAAYLFPVIGLAAPFAGLFGLGTYAAAAAGGFIIGALSELLAPSVDLGASTQRLNTSVNPNEPAKWIFGETALATDVVFAATHGSKDQYASQIIAGAAHVVEEFGDLIINDETISFSGDAATGEWADILWRQTNLGTESQTAFGNIDSKDQFSTGVWPATADGLGVAHYRLRWAVNKKKLQKMGGVPSRVTQVVKGCPVYDPRLDSTRGGSGAHRADDQSTWEYTNGGNDIGANWALVVLTYLLGWRWNSKLAWGVGVDPDDIDMAQAIACANVCDTTVDSIPKYRVGGIIPLTQDHDSVIQALEGAINGKVATIGGLYWLWAPHDDLTPFSSIGESDIVRAQGVEFEPSGKLELLYNTARGRYIEPSNTYQPTPYPDVEEPSAVTEDGRVRSVDHDLAFIQDVSIAQRVVRQIVRRSRFGGTWKFAMGPRGMLFQPFTVTTLNIKETNFEDVTVRILDMSFTTEHVMLTVIEEDSSIYNTSDSLGTPITQNDPGNQIPGTSYDDTIVNTRDDATCTTGVRIGADGHVYYTTPAGVYTSVGVPDGAWNDDDPISADRWARLTVNTGTLDNGVEDTWTALTADFDFDVIQDSVGTQNATTTVEIAEDSAGASVIQTIDYDITAVYQSSSPLRGTPEWFQSYPDPLPDPGIVNGDLLFIVGRGSFGSAPSGGWTNLWTPSGGIYVHWKIADGSNDTPNYTDLNEFPQNAAMLIAFKKPDTGSWGLAQQGSQVSSSQTSLIHNGISTLGIGHNIVLAVGQRLVAGSSSGTIGSISPAMNDLAGFAASDSNPNRYYVGVAWAEEDTPTAIASGSWSGAEPGTSEGVRSRLWRFDHNT